MEPGTQLGSYEIKEPLGKGGMGEVYRARDAKLERDVAIKVLSDQLADDPERLARLEREAKMLASLNHPNIGAIFGLEETDEGRPALVLELVEGPTLADRISRGSLPVEEALEIALQIAGALESAHERGIIHRDLKPANVKVDDDGTVKVLDFGLAKVLEPEKPEQEMADSPTLSAAATRPGLVLGTAAYMSPEQARGKPVDKRADIWAFGVVLLEMLTGEWTYQGETVSETLASVIKDDPDWEELPPEVTVQVRHLLLRCLEKDPHQRLRDIGEARIALDAALTDPGAATIASPHEGAEIASQRPGATVSAWRWGLRGAVAGILVAVLAVSFFQPRSERRRPVTFPIDFGTEQPPFVSSGPSLALSPDGSRLAVVAGHPPDTRLYVRSLEQAEPVALSGTTGARRPFFSPDGEWIGFFTKDSLKKIPVTGGTSITLCEVASNSRGGSWGDDGTIVFAPSNTSGLFRVPDTGGEPEPMTTPDPEQEGNSHRWPQVLPDGNGVLFIGGDSSNFADGRIMALSLETGEVRTVHRVAIYARYLPTGHLVYAHESTLFAAGFDPDRMELLGSPRPVLEDVLATPTNAAAQYAVADDGTLIYIAGSLTYENTLHWATRDGDLTPLIQEPESHVTPTVSPDGSRLALSIGWPVDQWDVWVRDLDRGTMARLTFGDAADGSPVWSPDSRWIAYARNFQIRVKRADGVGETMQLSKKGVNLVPADWSPDGRALLAVEVGGIGGSIDLRLLQLPDGLLEGEPFDPVESEPFLATEFDEGGATFSPDGRWVAYRSTESGQGEIYVQSFRGDGGKWQVSTDGGLFPVWSADGHELFYLDEDRIMAVSYTVSEGSFSAGRPRSIIDLPVAPTRAVPLPHYANLTAMPDGRRFVVLQGSWDQRAGETMRPMVVLDWFEELKRQVPPGE